jgi:hypothetical protein
LCPLAFWLSEAHNEVDGSQREQSRLIFNGPVGCSSNWQGFFNADIYMLDRSSMSSKSDP